MRIVPLNKVKNRPAEYLELAKRKDVIDTKKGRAAAALHGVTNENLEYYLFETDPALHCTNQITPSSIQRIWRNITGRGAKGARIHFFTPSFTPSSVPVLVPVAHPSGSHMITVEWAKTTRKIRK